MSPRFRLVPQSFLMLFVELALIRWTGSNVLYLSYFSNFVLLGSFLGIGIGFLRGARPRNLFRVGAGRARLARCVHHGFFPVKVRSRVGGDSSTSASCTPADRRRAVVLAVVFLVVAATMAFIGEGVARTFVKFEPLQAYRLDLFGSVLGIAGFSLLCRSSGSRRSGWASSLGVVVPRARPAARESCCRSVAVAAWLSCWASSRSRPA